MKIVNVGYNYRHSSDFCVDRPYGSGDCLLLIIRTAAFAILNGDKIEIAPNSILIFKKGTPQLYGASNGEYVNDWIHFEIDESEERAISELGIPFDTIIPLRDVTQFSDFIKCIFRERYSVNQHKDTAMQCYFDLIMLKISEEINQRGFENEHPYYDRFCILRNEIQLEPQKDWSIDIICKRLHISRSYLQHLYKLFFGTNIISEVKYYRIEYAKYLLISTNMTVSAISLSCGYKNDVHFMRIFKDLNGISPSEFRKKHRVSTEEIKNSKNKNPFSL